MTDETEIDPSKFSVNTREGEYFAEIEVIGNLRFTIKAESAADARRQLHDKVAAMYDDPFEAELDEVTDVNPGDIRAERPLYRVWDGYQKCQVSRLQPHHEPREPDERGF